MRMFPYSPINYSVAEPYDVRCTFDEEHHEWIYVFSMPEKDKAVLEEICKAYNIKAEDLIRQFYLWVIREPEAAAQWLKGENNRKKCILGDKRWIEPKKYGQRNTEHSVSPPVFFYLSANSGLQIMILHEEVAESAGDRREKRPDTLP